MEDFNFVNKFDASLYPEAKAELLAVLQQKVDDMLNFMKKMKGGVRNMRSTVEFEGTVFNFSLKLE